MVHQMITVWKDRPKGVDILSRQHGTATLSSGN